MGRTRGDCITPIYTTIQYSYSVYIGHAQCGRRHIVEEAARAEAQTSRKTQDEAYYGSSKILSTFGDGFVSKKGVAYD